MAKIGSIKSPDGFRDWHLVFYVDAGAGERKRRVYVTRNMEGHKLESARQAEQVLERIRGQVQRGRKLIAVLAEYTKLADPENHVIARWRGALLTEMRRRLAAGDIGQDRMNAFAHYERRGYLKFWKDKSIHAVNTPELRRWVAWLQEHWTHLQDVSRRHIVRDFGAFLGVLKQLGILDEVPEIPKVEIKRKRKRRIPRREAQLTILAQIPEERRGIWLARGLAGLRPAEARKANVSHYRDHAIHITAEICKTGDERTLLLTDVAPDLDAWISRHRAGAPPWEPLFPNPLADYRNPEKRWRNTAEWECWAAACKAAGVEHIKPNWGGRHAFATHEAKSGTNLMGLQSWMGHQDIGTTKLYVDSFDAEELAALMRPASIEDARKRKKSEP